VLAGPDVALLNVSRGGLLLESEVRLRPGSGICLNVVVDGETHRLDGRVVHADARLVANRVVYRAGVAFDREVPIFDPPCGAGPSRWQEAPVPEPPIEVTASYPGGRDLEAEVERLREECEAERRQREHHAQTITALREALRSGERLRQEMLEAHAAERALWDKEHHDLVERVREAEELSSAMMHDMRVARDAARRTARAHAAQLAAHDERVREGEQQLAALRAEQAALLASLNAQLETLEKREEGSRTAQVRMTGQLAASEAWCADQQDLLYRVRQQMSTVFALLEGGPPPFGADHALASGGALAGESRRHAAVLGAPPAPLEFPARRQLRDGAGRDDRSG
jgi:hypothetical protein